MKRTPLKRRTGLSRGKPPQAGSPGRGGSSRTKPRSTASAKVAAAKRPVRALEPGESLWKARRTGRCAVCGKRGPIVLHHLVDKNLLKRLGLPRYKDLRNALPVGAPLPWGGRCNCHGEHTDLGIGEKRIPFAKVPQAAREFAVEVLGEGPAENYWRRYYAP